MDFLHKNFHINKKKIKNICFAEILIRTFKYFKIV